MKKKRWAIIKLIICFILFSFACYKVYFWYTTTKETNEIIEEINNSIEINETKKEKKYNIDFNSLKEQNPDTVAYLKVNNTKIDYAVVRSNDNKYYLTHNFNKKGSASGWVFMDFHNKLDGTDKNIVIYGHSMLNKTMFGSLHNVVKSNWYTNTDNHNVVFVTEGNEYTAQVFSVYDIKVEDYYINTEFKSDEEFNKFINTLKKRSKYNFNVDVNVDDTILTLSTCGNGGKSRTVLHAKLVKEG